MPLLRWLLLAGFTVALSAFAQDDDDLSPIAPLKPKPVVKPKPRPAAKPVPKSPPKPVRTDDDELSPIATLKGEVNVRLAQSVSNAILLIDGKEIGPLPLSAQSTSTGEHTIKVRRPGYADFVKKVIVGAGKSVDVEVRLTAVNAVVVVTSDVDGAQVSINGKTVGTTPLSDVEVPPGSVEVVVHKDGYREERVRLSLVAGKDYPVAARLGAPLAVSAADRPVDSRLSVTEGAVDDGVSGGVRTTVQEQPLLSRWYVWVAAALVAVAAAAVGTYFAIQALPATRLPESTICERNNGVCQICVGWICGAATLPSSLSGSF